MINIKTVSENDVLSPVGGRKVGEEILKQSAQTPIILDFGESGSHTALFFNAMFGVLKTATNLQINQDLILKNETSLDADTYQRSKDNFLNKMEKA